MAAAKRLSPGVYQVNGKTVQAQTAAEAERIAGGNKGGGNNKDKAPKTPKEQPILPKNTKINNAPSAIKAEKKVEDYEADKRLEYGNPNVSGPFGGRRLVTDPNTGEQYFEDYLSPEGEQIRQGDDAISRMGREFAQKQLQGGGFDQQFDPNLTARQSTGDFVADRKRIEDEVFNRLIGDNEERYSQAREAKKQELYNQGVPLRDIDSDPRMKEVEKNFQSNRDNARADAVRFGGDEYSRSFGIQEQLRANEYSEQANTRNQRYGEVGGLSQLGPGLRVPNLNPVQGTDYNVGSPTEYDLAYKQLKEQKRQFNRQNQRSGGGGGMTSGPAQEPSPFIASYNY